MLDACIGFIVAGLFMVAGMCYQECRYRSLKKELEIKSLEKKIEELKKTGREALDNNPAEKAKLERKYAK